MYSFIIGFVAGFVFAIPVTWILLSAMFASGRADEQADRAEAFNQAFKQK